MSTTRAGQPLGNQLLVEYGIQTEQSDLRAHVCVQARCVYVYPTQSGLKALQSDVYPLRDVHTWVAGKRVLTARGYLVPPSAIRGCTPIPVPRWRVAAIFEDEPTTRKGQKCLHVVRRLLEMGLVPLPASTRVIERVDLQVQGMDILVALNARIQVKCDYRGGAKELGGTGNLFLQVAECNPLGSH